VNVEGVGYDVIPYVPDKTFTSRAKQFKLGIELEEVSGLCPSAKADFAIQKEAVFFVHFKGQTLWELQIDGTDLEFVTRPFTYEQIDDLKLCMQSIKFAVELLKQKQTSNISFESWIEELTENFYKAKNNLSLIIKYIPSHKIIKPSLNWDPVFAPHVTIQHPLEWTIPLYAVLFKQKTQFPDSNEIAFNSVLPLKDEWIHPINQDTKNKIFKLYITNKALGLMFLNAFTMFSMTQDGNDDTFIEKTLDAYHNYGQFDAKMTSALVSRRPFSQMYADLGVKESVSNIIRLLNWLITERKSFLSELLLLRHGVSPEHLLEQLLKIPLTKSLYIQLHQMLPHKLQKALLEQLEGKITIPMVAAYYAWPPGKLQQTLQMPLEQLQLFPAFLQKQISEDFFELILNLLEQQGITSVPLVQLLETIVQKLSISKLPIHMDHNAYKKVALQLLEECLKQRLPLKFSHALKEDTLTESINFLSTMFSPESTYRDVFNAVILMYNEDFSDVEENFYKANYGEQYYEYSEGRHEPTNSINFSKLITHFKDEFRQMGDPAILSITKIATVPCTTFHETRLIGLLANGILTTTMLRNLDNVPPKISNYFQRQYYMDVLESVSNPERHKQRTVILTTDTDVKVNFGTIEYLYDLLSPPVFLDIKSDAMGHYKHITEVEKYGEAVVETRTISDIGLDLLSKMELDANTKGRFLRRLNDIELHATKFLEFLSCFEKDIQSAILNGEEVSHYVIDAIENIVSKRL
jgi:hypothetical protein